MNKSQPAAAGKVFLLYSLVFSTLVAAQGVGPVVDSQGITPGRVSPQSANSTSGNEAMILLLDQNRQLQTEIQALRAMVEELGFNLHRLEQDSLNRYANVDERLAELENNAPAGVANGGVPVNPVNSISTIGTAAGGLSPVAPPDTRSSGADSIAAPATPTDNRDGAGSSRANRRTLQPAVLSEQQLYQMAYDSVIGSNFQQSLAEFDQYLSVYPGGRFVTNAHYWKGQAYLYLNRFAEARESYEIILDRYPDSPKLPDALYGLALSYQGMGNIAQARRLLNDIKRRFPNTGVANLADTRLLSLD